jgi:hypothetical protein
MSYEAFLEKVEEVLGYKPRPYCSGSYRSKHGLNEQPAIYISWSTGGQSGGSCWGNSEHYAVEGEAQPDFDELDKILEAICPEITFMKYKNLCREVIKDDSYCSNDYYGNYTNYARKVVGMRNLYDAINSRGLGDW